MKQESCDEPRKMKLPLFGTNDTNSAAEQTSRDTNDPRICNLFASPSFESSFLFWQSYPFAESCLVVCRRIYFFFHATLFYLDMLRDFVVFVILMHLQWYTEATILLLLLLVCQFLVRHAVDAFPSLTSSWRTIARGWFILPLVMLITAKRGCIWDTPRGVFFQCPRTLVLPTHVSNIRCATKCGRNLVENWRTRLHVALLGLASKYQSFSASLSHHNESCGIMFAPPYFLWRYLSALFVMMLQQRRFEELLVDAKLHDGADEESIVSTSLVIRACYALVSLSKVVSVFSIVTRCHVATHSFDFGVILFKLCITVVWVLSPYFAVEFMGRQEYLDVSDVAVALVLIVMCAVCYREVVERITAFPDMGAQFQNCAAPLYTFVMSATDDKEREARLEHIFKTVLVDGMSSKSFVAQVYYTQERLATVAKREAQQGKPLTMLSICGVDKYIEAFGNDFRVLRREGLDEAASIADDMLERQKGKEKDPQEEGEEEEEGVVNKNKKKEEKAKTPRSQPIQRMVLVLRYVTIAAIVAIWLLSIIFNFFVRDSLERQREEDTDFALTFISRSVNRLMSIVTVLCLTVMLVLIPHARRVHWYHRNTVALHKVMNSLKYRVAHKHFAFGPVIDSYFSPRTCDVLVKRVPREVIPADVLVHVVAPFLLGWDLRTEEISEKEVCEFCSRNEVEEEEGE